MLRRVGPCDSGKGAMPFGRGRKSDKEETWVSQEADVESNCKLKDGSRVAVIGGGPAGSFTSYFLLDMADMIGLDIEVDIYEPRNYTRPGPASCNHCGGIVSESLVQMLATDGINLPAAVVQRGIDSYVLHMDLGSVRIDTPLHEKRIAAVHRGAGPRGVVEPKWASLDGFLLGLALERGAQLVPQRVDELSWIDGMPEVKTRMGLPQTYDLVVGAVGVNTNALKLFRGLEFGYEPPETTKTYICELPFGAETVERYAGTSMHVFLLDLPRLEFAAIVPKGEFLTVILLGESIDKDLVARFLSSPEVERCLPPGWEMPEVYCHCSPMINIEGSAKPFTDRLVLVGDCGATRLFKDGIGAAYRSAKMAASAAVFNGVSADDFAKHYGPSYDAIGADNRLGKLVFAVTRQMQKRSLGRRMLIRMVSREQWHKDAEQRMSLVLWDTFTGSASYREILLRTIHPYFIAQCIRHLGVATARLLMGRLRTFAGNLRSRPVSSENP